MNFRIKNLKCIFLRQSIAASRLVIYLWWAIYYETFVQKCVLLNTCLKNLMPISVFAPKVGKNLSSKVLQSHFNSRIYTRFVFNFLGYLNTSVLWTRQRWQMDVLNCDSAAIRQTHFRVGSGGSRTTKKRPGIPDAHEDLNAHGVINLLARRWRIIDRTLGLNQINGCAWLFICCTI